MRHGTIVLCRPSQRRNPERGNPACRVPAIVARGNLGGIEYDDENQIVIGLTSVDGSGVHDYAVFEYDTAVFGNDVTAVTVHLFENLPSQWDARVAATPEAQS